MSEDQRLNNSLSTAPSSLRSRTWPPAGGPSPASEPASSFIAFQVALYFLLLGQRTMGLRTPAGNVLPYKINALAATLVTIGEFFLGSYAPSPASSSAVLVYVSENHSPPVIRLPR